MSNSAQPASAPDALIADLKNWAALFLKDEWETLPSHLNQADDALSAQQKRIAALEQDVTCAEQYSAKVLSDNVDKDLRIAELSAAEANYLHFKSECAKRDKRIAALEAWNTRAWGLLERCSRACQIVPNNVRNGEHISLPSHVEKLLKETP